MHILTHSIIKKNVDSIPIKTKRGRPLKEPVDHYIMVIGHVLKTGAPWASLDGLFSLHWTTYHKKFMLWSKEKVFENSYTSILSLLQCNNKLNSDVLKDLFIDSTMIKNIQGVELLGRNHYDRNKFGNKITIVVTQSGIPLSLTIDEANKHDTKLTEKAVINAKIKIVGSRLMADKGYTSTELKTKLKKKHNITLIYPYKKNQKTKNTTVEKELLKKRYIVENFFAWLKNNRRIRSRYDKKSSTYLQFCYLGCLDLIAKKLF